MRFSKAGPSGLNLHRLRSGNIDGALVSRVGLSDLKEAHRVTRDLWARERGLIGLLEWVSSLFQADLKRAEASFELVGLRVRSSGFAAPFRQF